MVADLYRSNLLTFRQLLPVIGWLVGLCAVAAVGVAIFGRSDVGVFPMLPLRHYIFTLLCVVLMGTAAPRLLVGAAAPFARPAAYVASISYGLYVFHYPLLIQWEGAATPVGFTLAFIALIAFSVFGDRGMERWLPRPQR